MIELNDKTQQDFLNREWVQKLLDAGVDMSDAYYGIARDTMHGNRDKIFFIHMWGLEDTESFTDKIPTYTVSDLLYKLPANIYPTINGKKYFGYFNINKDSSDNTSFYKTYYALYSEYYIPSLEQGDYTEGYIYADSEDLIESLASLLIQCHKKGISLKTKDTGNISNK